MLRTCFDWDPRQPRPMLPARFRVEGSLAAVKGRPEGRRDSIKENNENDLRNWI